MDGSNIRGKPKAKAGDVAHTLTKAGLSAIPVVGGPAAELFSAIIVPPLAKRRDEWIESVVEGLKALEERVNGFEIEALSQNETFITTVMHASQAAIRNHQKEKREALRNAVLNSASSNDLEEDLQLMFLNFADTLTPLHLRILKFLNDPHEWCQRNEIACPDLTMGSISSILELALPELEGRRELYDQVVKDLFSRGLIGTDSLHSIMSSAGIFAPRTTDMGKRFIDFVTSPIESDDEREQ
jgi:hypothetical protein